MAWRLAKSLEKLRTQLNAVYPNRSKVSDGSIGDQAHAARASDHNPNSAGVVCAIDITNDPVGPQGHTLSRQLIRDFRVKYVIFGGEIWKARTRQWEPYHGANAHNHHVHVSVQVPVCDDLSAWKLESVPNTPQPETPQTLRRGDSGEAVKALQSKLGIEVDGQFGFGTERAVKRFQLAHGLTDDGIAGPQTREAMK